MDTRRTVEVVGTGGLAVNQTPQSFDRSWAPTLAA